MTQSYPAYQLTCADIDRLKVVAARIFDRKVSPQSRLEIIARSSGFNTFAAMKAALKTAPVLLVGSQYCEETHIRSAGIDPKYVPFINGVSLNEIIAAGLAWSERDDPEWATSKPARQRLKMVKKDGATLRDYLDFLYDRKIASGDRLNVYRSSLTWADIRKFEEDAYRRKACAETAVIMTSPENAMDVSMDPMTGEPRMKRPGAWRCARIPLSDDMRFFEDPSAQLVPWDDRSALEQLIEDARIIVFDDNDLKAVRRELSKAGISDLPDYRFTVTKQDALEIEDETEGNFFTLGYYGTARNDGAPSEICNDGEALSDYAFSWFCEIVSVVHGCAYEYRRITIGGSSHDYGSDFEDRDHLIIPV